MVLVWFLALCRVSILYVNLFGYSYNGNISYSMSCTGLVKHSFAAPLELGCRGISEGCSIASSYWYNKYKNTNVLCRTTNTKRTKLGFFFPLRSNSSSPRQALFCESLTSELVASIAEAGARCAVRLSFFLARVRGGVVFVM